MKQLLENNNKILMEAAIIERLRRSNHFELHPELVNAPLIYNNYGKEALLSIYQEYVDIALKSKVPLLLCTPTWRANYARVVSSNISESINIDAVKFLMELNVLMPCRISLYEKQGEVFVSTPNLEVQLEALGCHDELKKNIIDLYKKMLEMIKQW